MKKLITAVTLATVCFFSMNAGASLIRSCKSLTDCKCQAGKTASCTDNKCNCTSSSSS